jgi:signal transduction histidine kinase
MSETSRLSQLINNILDFSRINSRKKEYHFTPTDLRELILEALDMYQFHLEKHNFELDLQMDENIPLVKADTESIKQAFVNVLDNAVKYSQDQRYIRIGLQQNHNRVELSISDRGIGIPPSEHKKILDKFYRVGSSLVHNTKGSGLGLSLVKHIMDIHNGEINVESTPDEGSTFTLIFPAEQLVEA